jgi:hypothetical protein
MPPSPSRGPSFPKPPKSSPDKRNSPMKARCDIRSTPLRRRSGYRRRLRHPPPTRDCTAPDQASIYTLVRNKARCAVTALIMNSVVLRRNNSGFKLGILAILRFCDLNNMRSINHLLKLVMPDDPLTEVDDAFLILDQSTHLEHEDQHHGNDDLNIRGVRQST